MKTLSILSAALIMAACSSSPCRAVSIGSLRMTATADEALQAVYVTSNGIPNVREYATNLWIAGTQTTIVWRSVTKMLTAGETLRNVLELYEAAGSTSYALRVIGFSAINATSLVQGIVGTASTNAAVEDAKARDIVSTNDSVKDAAIRDIAVSNGAALDAQARINSATNYLVKKSGDTMGGSLYMMENSAYEIVLNPTILAGFNISGNMTFGSHSYPATGYYCRTDSVTNGSYIYQLTGQFEGYDYQFDIWDTMAGWYVTLTVDAGSPTRMNGWYGSSPAYVGASYYSLGGGVGAGSVDYVNNITSYSTNKYETELKVSVGDLYGSNFVTASGLIETNNSVTDASARDIIATNDAVSDAAYRDLSLINRAGDSFTSLNVRVSGNLYVSDLYSETVTVMNIAVSNTALFATNCTLSGVLNMGKYNITNLLDPTRADMAATMAYVDRATNCVSVLTTNAVIGDVVSRDIVATNDAVNDAAARDIVSTNDSVKDAAARDIISTNDSAKDASARDIISTNDSIKDAAARDIISTNDSIKDAAARDIVATNDAIKDASARDIVATNDAVKDASARDIVSTNEAVKDAASRDIVATNDAILTSKLYTDAEIQNAASSYRTWQFWPGSNSTVLSGAKAMRLISDGYPPAGTWTNTWTSNTDGFYITFCSLAAGLTSLKAGLYQVNATMWRTAGGGDLVSFSSEIYIRGTNGVETELTPISGTSPQSIGTTPLEYIYTLNVASNAAMDVTDSVVLRFKTSGMAGATLSAFISAGYFSAPIPSSQYFLQSSVPALSNAIISDAATRDTTATNVAILDAASRDCSASKIPTVLTHGRTCTISTTSCRLQTLTATSAVVLAISVPSPTTSVHSIRLELLSGGRSVTWDASNVTNTTFFSISSNTTSILFDWQRNATKWKAILL